MREKLVCGGDVERRGIHALISASKRPLEVKSKKNCRRSEVE